MYGLQTAPSPRRMNGKIQRDIGNQHHDCLSIKETNFFFEFPQLELLAIEILPFD